DSTTLSEQALTAARNQVRELYGPAFLPDAPRVYTKKAKGAQEAHEAIRPAGESFRTPEEIRAELDEDAFKLYDLIWKRTVASQMKDAQGQRTQMRFSVALEAPGNSDGSTLASTAVLSASGKVITFPGFLRAYVEGSDDPEAELEEQERILPDLQVGDRVSATETWAKEHTTQPPARYTEASLVKELEDRGIGRPSTYASIIQTIQDRGYVWKKGGALVPTFTAFAVTNLLEQHFGELVDYEFTARMEGDLDEISHGEKNAEPWLEHFFFGVNGRPQGATGARRGTLSEVGLKDRIEGSVEEIDARRICSMPIGKTADGQELVARVGRYGPYLQVGDGDQRANLPDELEPDELNLESALRLIAQAGLANRSLGQHPETGQPVYLKTGRYGPYVQLGDPELTPKGNIKKGVKPKMSSLFPGMSLESLTLDDAVYLLSFPRTVGVNPDTGGTITAQDGQYGPYLTMETDDGKRDSRSLENHDQLRNITLDEAVAIFRQPKQRGRNRVQRSDLAELGTSPVTGKPIQVKTGRFGPYVTDGQVNATIPSNRDPAKLTHDDALELIAQREERMREQGKDPRPGAKKTLPVKKAASKLSTRDDDDGESSSGKAGRG
ncbi:MAG: DNA topoisomerase, partial [Myxococcota bacterium]